MTPPNRPGARAGAWIFMLFLALAPTAALAAAPEASLRLAPSCPIAGGEIDVLITPSGSGNAALTLLDPALEVAGDVLTVALDYYYTGFLPPAVQARSASVRLPALPSGTYRFEVVGRPTEAPNEPFTTLSHTTVHIRADARECRFPGRLARSSAAFQQIFLVTPYRSAFLVVQVLDASFQPVPNAEVHFEQYFDVQAMPLSSMAGVAFSKATSDSSGYASATVYATGVGTSQFEAWTEIGGHRKSAYFVVSTRDREGPPVRPVIEYARSPGGPFFLTSSEVETFGLDEGLLSGWYRTGNVFLSYTGEGRIPPPENAAPVCRLYGPVLGAHFFSASQAECADVLTRWPESWMLETPSAFLVPLPDMNTGICPESTQPVYRLFNNRADVSHRYVVESNVRHRMLNGVDSTWTTEGYGPNGVAMCAPL